MAVVVGKAGDVADAGPIEEVAAEAALEWRAGGGGDAEGGEVEGAREGEEGVFGVVWSGPPAAAERGAVERQRLRRWGLRGLRGGAAEGSEVEAEEEAAGGGEAEAREEAAWVEMLERRRHGTER